jgi:hypothetical protein
LTSDRKIKANRANARASTGPKTRAGRTRSARNALRHALSLPVYSDPLWSEQLETLAREIAGPSANAETQELARQVAEAQIDLRRVRYARHQLLSDSLSNQFARKRTDEIESHRPPCAGKGARYVDGSLGEVCNFDAARAEQVGNDPVARS